MISWMSAYFGIWKYSSYSLVKLNFVIYRKYFKYSQEWIFVQCQVEKFYE